MKLKLNVVLIIPFLMIGAVPIINLTHGQTSVANQELINGLLTPRIDGLIDNSNLLDKTTPLLSEWGDASIRTADFYLSKSAGLNINQEEEEPIQMRLFSKWVGNDFYFSFDFPKSTLSSVSIQFDFDNNGKLSDGDLRMVANLNLVPQKGIQLDFIADSFSYGVENKLQIFMDGTWRDPTDLNPKLWNTKNWNPLALEWNPNQNGFSKYADLLSNVGKIAISPSGGDIGQLIGPMFDVEMRFSPSSYGDFLKLAVPTLSYSLNLNEVINNEIRYATMITTTTGAVYGYPVRPTIVDNSNTFSMTEFVADFYEPRIPLQLQQDVGIDHIEMTQTVQTANNDLSLVLNKQSLARVFVANPSTATVEVEVTLTAYAFAFITIIEIGSLSQVFNAPTSPDRTVLSNSANFDMPDDWTSIPWLILKAQVTPVGKLDPNQADNTLSEAFELKETHDLNVYYIRVNTGTAAVINQVSQATADSITSAFAASYPVANPNFIQLDRSVLGTDADGWSSSTELKDALTDIVGEIVFTIIFQLLLGVTDVLPVPDQIFGMKPTGGGSSTPSWGDYDASFASWGSPTASSGSLVMAHEVNHNLGDNNWGRHVGNPDDTTWGGTNINKDLNWGCGASGPDAAWPGLNDNLNQDFADTLGWNPGTGLVQNTKNDLMSYCNGGTPAKWISDYRWEALVDRLENFVSGSPAPLSIMSFNDFSVKNVNTNPIEPNFTLLTTRIISGVVTKDGSGYLNPSFTRIGTISKILGIHQGITPSVFLDVTFANKTTIRYEFEPDFTDHADTDHPQDGTFPFNFWIPDDGQIVKIELLDTNSNLLDSKVGTGFSLDQITPVNFIIPKSINRGEKNSIQWSYNKLSNTSAIFAQVQYSHDGLQWFNLGKKTTGDSLSENFVLESLPGGAESQFRLMLTDGFDTKYVIAGQTTPVPLLSPIVSINKNANLFNEDISKLGLNQVTSLADPRPSPVGSLISFKATAFDPQKGTMDASTLSWTVTEVAENGLALSQSTASVVDDTFRFRFSRPGLYKIEATVKSAEGLAGSDSILVKIVPAASIDAAEFNKFTVLLKELRDDTTTDTKSSETISTSTKEESSSKSDSAGLPIPTFVLILPLLFTGVVRIVNRRKQT